MSTVPCPHLPFLLRRVTALIGPYGSGKSELAIGLALHAAEQVRLDGTHVRKAVLGDLDVLKPYFRSREIGMRLQQAGVGVVAPQGALANSDLPILAPELRGAVQRTDVQVVLDVGGDPVGARALGSIADVVGAADHELLLVLNRYRPFMDSAARVLEQARQIEAAAQLRIGGIISNTNVLEETTPDDVRWGLELAREVAAMLEVPVRLLAVPDHLAPEFAAAAGAAPGAAALPPMVVIRRQMKPNFLGGVVLSSPPLSHA